VRISAPQRVATHPWLSTGLSLLLWVVAAEVAIGEQIRVAVASNFGAPMREIAGRFEANSAHDITLVLGSTGKHYAQILNGAPFDLFFAADAKRPQLLQKAGKGVTGTCFTYAIGRLVLWSSDAGLVDGQGNVLTSNRFERLAIANPRFAPYGLAAQQVLQSLGLWGLLESQLIRGENVAQTFQFVSSGNVELGFVAWSQIRGPEHRNGGSHWLVPETLHEPIEQQAILLRDGVAAREFVSFVRADEARQIMANHGYGAPN